MKLIIIFVPKMINKLSFWDVFLGGLFQSIYKNNKILIN